MKKIVFILLVTVLACSFLFAGAEETQIKWELVFETDFESEDPFDSEFLEYFNVSNLQESNLVTDGGNTYYAGEWTNGANLYYKENLEEFCLTFDMKTDGFLEPERQNAYKSGAQFFIPEEILNLNCEPDNYDEDKSSYLGCGGITLYMGGSVLEVVIRSNKDGGTAGPVNGIGVQANVAKASDRHFGMYGVGYSLTLPEGASYTNFNSMKVTFAGNVFSVYFGENLFCTVELSNINKTTVCINQSYFDYNEGDELISDNVYRTAVLKDASGETLLTVEDAVVPVSGAFAFMDRCPKFFVDNIKLYEISKSKETPSDVTAGPSEATEKPADKTTEAPVSKVTDSPKESSGGSDSAVVIILICAIVLVIALIAVVFLKKKKK